MKQRYILFALMFCAYIWGNKPVNNPEDATNIHKTVSLPTQHPDTSSTHVKKLLATSPITWSTYLSQSIEQSDSLLFRLFLVLLLGILLSFTPCIYPMIPITVGILHQHASQSVMRNFMRSAAYTAGIATTFAMLGLAAAFAGQLFGSLLASPYVVVTIMVILAYFGFSMMGFYEPYVPLFASGNRQNPAGGSLVSCFIFGAISGTVASPCVSPGLLFLLTLVTTLASKLMGFVLLFTFGVGLSIPLLIIGTSTSSLSLLPRAGAWMVETKKLFGLLMIGMCFYYAQNILAYPWVIGLAIIGCTLASGWYLYQALYSKAKHITLFYGFMSLALCIGTGTLSYALYKEQCCTPQLHVQWYDNYAQALACAQQEHKYLFVDINTPYCVLCKGIEHKILQTPEVAAALDSCVPVVIDGSDKTIVAHQDLQLKHQIKGVPALLLIDAQSGELIKQWGGEIYGMQPSAFAQEINELT